MIDDLISRQAAIRIAEQGQIQGYEWQFKELIKLPSVKQEPKTGHWIRDTITDLYHCSKCRSICHQDPKSKDDYCRYCGAKMKEGD